ncbi:hypothetical protein SAMN05216357_13118 [Porphyromonadaceae bacterium KH3CP3RA]|nr:hypothetical protein SAMN05216357_13118 [Porphyromonadaceae bacterium KH3CP3RA]
MFLHEEKDKLKSAYHISKIHLERMLFAIAVRKLRQAVEYLGNHGKVYIEKI